MTTAGVSGTGNPPGRPNMAGVGTTKDEDVLYEMRERFGSSAAANKENRESYITDVNFSSSADMWPEQVKKLRGDHRPTLTFNRLNGVIKQIIGDYRQNKLAIKVVPSGNGASEEVADILAGLLRNIEMESDADSAYTNGLECSARGGFGYFRFITEYEGADSFDQNIVIKPIYNPLTVYFDPAARLITRADARWCFVTEMMPKSEFKRQYPKASDTGFSVADDDESMQDWGGDEADSEIRIAEYYTKETSKVRLAAFDNGAVVEIDNDEQIAALQQVGWKLVKERDAERINVRWRKVTGLEILEERVYKTSYIPVIPVIGEEVNLQGKVYTRSAIYYGKDAQHMYNYWKTAATESVALSAKAPWKVTAREIEGYEEQWNNVNSTPQPYLVFNPDPEHPQGPERIDPPNQPIGEMAMAGQAGIDIQYTTNIFDASLGQKGGEVSGVAIGERQQQGATGTYIFIDNLRKSIEHLGRALIDWIRIVYDTERVVRIIGLEGDSDTETINQQKQNPLMGITEVLNDITVGKYDVVVETGPAFASRRREAVDGMMKFMQAMPQLGSIIADLAVKNMDWPGADEISARLKRALPPQIANDPDSPEGQQAAQQAQTQQQQHEQMQQQMMQQHMQVQNGKIQADMAKSQASVVKSQAEVIKAKADVIEAVHGQKEAEHVDASRPAAPAPQSNSNHGMQIQLVKSPEDHAHDAESMAHAHELRHAVAGMAQHMIASHQMNQQQSEKMHELMGHLVNSHAAVTHAINQSNQIASAPTEAVRDKAGRITGSKKVFN